EGQTVNSCQKATVAPLDWLAWLILVLRICKPAAQYDALRLQRPECCFDIQRVETKSSGERGSRHRPETFEPSPKYVGKRLFAQPVQAHPSGHGDFPLWLGIRPNHLDQRPALRWGPQGSGCPFYFCSPSRRPQLPEIFLPGGAVADGQNSLR